MIKNSSESLIPGMESNVGNTQRVLSVIAGSLLLYRSFSKKKKSIPKALAGAFLLFRGTTGFCPATKAAQSLTGPHTLQNINIKTNLSVNKSPEEVYNFWRRLENLPLFMKHLKRVKILDEKFSEWEARIPGGIGSIKWKSEIVKDIPNIHLGWQSLADSAIENAGNVRFTDAGKYGTEIHVVISYKAPGGFAGEKVGRLLNPAFEKMVREDIKNLKRYLETGEIPTVEGQPAGR